MGFNNNNRNKGNNNQKSSVKRYKGKNVSPFSGVTQMKQYASRMIRNIAFGNFNLATDGIMFQNIDFLNAVLQEAQEKIVEQQYYYGALTYAYANSNDAIIIHIINKHKRSLDGWTLVYNTIGAIIQTGDFGLLAGLMNRLPDYKHVL